MALGFGADVEVATAVSVAGGVAGVPVGRNVVGEAVGRMSGCWLQAKGIRHDKMSNRVRTMIRLGSRLIKRFSFVGWRTKCKQI